MDNKKYFQMRFETKRSARKVFQWKGTTPHVQNCRGGGSCMNLTADKKNKSQAIQEITMARAIQG